jgi:hypothetical protein
MIDKAKEYKVQVPVYSYSCLACKHHMPEVMIVAGSLDDAACLRCHKPAVYQSVRIEERVIPGRVVRFAHFIGEAEAIV